MLSCSTFGKFSPYMILTIWILLTAIGLSIFSWYSTTENALQQEHSTPVTFPELSHVQLTEGTNTCIIFLHPRCPCSEATLTEWQRAVQAGRNSTRFYAVFFGGDGSTAQQQQWLQHTYLWNAVANLPSVIPLIDSASVIASQFGAYTSGFTVLYDKDKKLLYSGGLTVARGHEGYNLYSHRLTEMVSNSKQDNISGSFTAPVYGCGLSSH